MPDPIEGTLSDYWEQGFEGHFELILQPGGDPRLESMEMLSPGDHLTVWDAANHVIFDGPLPVWTGRWVLVFFWVEPKLPPGFFDWFRVHHHRARLTRPRR